MADTSQSLAPPSDTPLPQFLRSADECRGAGAICVFSMDGRASETDYKGFVALVLAYSRSHEPVSILDDDSIALLIRTGGQEAADAAARRLHGLATRVQLGAFLHSGVAAIGDSSEVALELAHAEAISSPTSSATDAA